MIFVNSMPRRREAAWRIPGSLGAVDREKTLIKWWRGLTRDNDGFGTEEGKESE